MSSGKIVEGIFAVNKPQWLSSAQALGQLQRTFNQSKLFQPWIQRAAEIRDENQRHNKKAWRKKSPRIDVKMGHGGTLDPLATGVLIIAIGKYTKELSQFLSCTKTYEAIVLFGCATASHDRVSDVLGKRPYSHITRKTVEEALEKFKGKIMQRPPIYSALRHEGKRLYEYAREGKAIPEGIKDREVEVLDISLVDWYEGGTHSHRFPSAQASQDLQKDAAPLLEVSKPAVADKGDAGAAGEEAGVKRKAADESTPNEALAEPSSKRQKAATLKSEGGQQGQVADVNAATEPSSISETGGPDVMVEDDGSQAPAAKIRMTVSSGFYVRSLCHDLGEAVDSYALMAELVRTRQGQFEMGRNVFDFDQAKEREDVWAPQLESLLEQSSAKP